MDNIIIFLINNLKNLQYIQYTIYKSRRYETAFRERLFRYNTNR